MRVTLVHWTFPPTVGGVETHLVDLASKLAQAGVEVTVVSGEESPDRTTVPRNVSFVYAAALDRNSSVGVAGGCPVRAAQSLYCSLRKGDPDAIHAHNIFPIGGSSLARVFEQVGGVLVHTSHSEWRYGGEVPSMAKWRLLAASRFLAKRIRETLGWYTSAVTLPIDSTRFAASGAPLLGSDIRLLHPARLVVEKGFVQSITTLAVLGSLGIEATLTLTDPFRTFGHRDGLCSVARMRANALISSLGVQNRVGFVSSSLVEMPELYNAHDIVLYPSLFDEPLGLVALEGMSCERPIVASRVGGLLETIRHKTTGILVTPGSTKELVDAIISLVGRPAEARDMARLGREDVRSRFSLDHYTSQMIECYSSNRVHGQVGALGEVQPKK